MKNMKKRAVALACATAMIIEGNGGVPAEAAGAPVSLSNTSITPKEGKSKTITVKKTGKVSIKKKTFKTSDKKVAAVTKKGKVTAKKAGKATIKVAVKYKKGKKTRFTTLKCRVTVTGKGSGNSNHNSNHSPSTAAPGTTSGNSQNQPPSGGNGAVSPAPTVSQNPFGTESPVPSTSQNPAGTGMPTKEPDISAEPTSMPGDLVKEAGLYDADEKMIKTWGELREEGSVEVVDGVLTNGIKDDLSGELIIGEEVERIENGAFMNCSSLTSVTIPVSVTAVGRSNEYLG